MTRRPRPGARVPLASGMGALVSSGVVMRGGGTGFRPRRPLPEWSPVERRHLWAVLCVFSVDMDRWAADPDYAPLFDFDSLLGLPQGPVCYHCERAFTTELAARPCPGDPP